MRTHARTHWIAALGATIAAVAAIGMWLAPTAAVGAPNASPPATHVKLVFIHHSTGEQWLADGYGGLGLALRNAGYFVSDTYYGWGPDSIGDRTDIGDWWTWFRGPRSATYTAALYAQSRQETSYSRLASDPRGENQIVVFKSCFPNSELGGSPTAPIPLIGANPMKGQSAGDSSYTVANAKSIYRDLLAYFRTRPDKLFVLIVSPPMASIGHPANARALADWLVSPAGWLNGYPLNNVAVFDYYNVLTAPANHHWYHSGAVEDTHSVNHDVLYYPSGDDHPNPAGDRKATAEFVPLLNIAYHRWRASLTPTVSRPTTAVFLNSVVLDTAAQKTTRFKLRVAQSSVGAKLTLATPRGTVTLYNGAAAAPGLDRWSSPWNGLVGGARLPPGRYVWTLVLTKTGYLPLTVRGQLLVCNHAVVIKGVGTGRPQLYPSALNAGPAVCFESAKALTVRLRGPASYNKLVDSFSLASVVSRVTYLRGTAAPPAKGSYTFSMTAPLRVAYSMTVAQ